MAYESGSASGPHDLLAKIRAFAIAQGWTSNRYDTDPIDDDARNELCLSKGSSFFSLASFQNSTVAPINTGIASVGNPISGVVVSGADGYSGSAQWDRQPGHAESLFFSSESTNQMHAYLFGENAYPSYHFFTPNNNCIYIEVEVSNGVYQRVGLGTLDTLGSPPGGGRFFYGTTGFTARVNPVSNPTFFNSGTNSSTASFEMVPFRAAEYSNNRSTLHSASYVRMAFGDFDGWAQSSRFGFSYTGAECQGGTHEQMLYMAAPAPLNGLGILTPIVVSYNAGNEFLMPIGRLPGIRYMRMDLYQPQEEFNLGSETWKVFPWWQKSGNSSEKAIAYLKVT